jgi:hypothetical protein
LNIYGRRLSRDKRSNCTVFNKVELAGQFVVWLASKQVEFAKGKLAFAKWAVENLVRNKEVFESDGKSATVQCASFMSCFDGL